MMSLYDEHLDWLSRKVEESAGKWIESDDFNGYFAERLGFRDARYESEPQTGGLVGRLLQRYMLGYEDGKSMLKLEGACDTNR